MTGFVDAATLGQLLGGVSAWIKTHQDARAARLPRCAQRAEE